MPRSSTPGVNLPLGWAWFQDSIPAAARRGSGAYPSAETAISVWDDQLKGFGARVYPNGNKRYVAQTFRRGKTIRVQIGRHGALPFEEAKARARKIIADIDDGRNPNREKEAERLSPTVAQLSERFLEEYVPVHCKPRTRVEYVHAVKRYIPPPLGEIRVVALARDDVAALHHGMRDKPYQANRTLGVVSKMMNLAEAWALRPDRSNPCYHIRKYKERKHEDGYIRRLLVHGARSVLRWRRSKPGTGPGWTDRLLARRPTNVVLVAMANNTSEPMKSPS